MAFAAPAEIISSRLKPNHSTTSSSPGVWGWGRGWRGFVLGVCRALPGLRALGRAGRERSRQHLLLLAAARPWAEVWRGDQAGLWELCLFVCLLDGLFYFDLISRRGFVCLFWSLVVLGGFCLFSLLIYKNCIFWLRAAGSWKIPGLRSPWLGDCTASHSCWGRSCIFCLFYRILLHFELRGVTICTVPALPASVEILGPGTHGMCTTLSCPWNPRNSGTHGGSEVCRAHDKRAHNKHTARTGHTHRASQRLLGQIHLSTGSAPLMGHLGQSPKPLPHLHTHNPSTHSLPKPLPCRNQHRGTGTLQLHSAVFLSQWHRDDLERHWDDTFPLCTGKRNEANVFSFGYGLDLTLQPRSHRSSPVSVLIHLGNGGLVLGAGDIFTCSPNL